MASRIFINYENLKRFILLINGTPTDTTTPGQSGSGSKGKEG